MRHSAAMSGNILVIGGIGQIGHELARARWPAGLATQFVERDRLDLARPAEVKAAVAAMRPRLVINAGAYTAVDQAETERETAFAINRDGPAALAEACRELGAALIHFSTDYVFDGSKHGPYTEADPVCPLSVYGASKAEGDAAIAERLDRHVILRTSWVYSAVGHNFVKTMLRLGGERDELRIVDDQHGAPTAAAELARAAIHIAAALDAGKGDGFGVFNFTAERGAKVPPRVRPIATEDYPLPAARPRNSRLDCAKISRVYGLVAKPWQDSLADCLDELMGRALSPRTAQGAAR